MSIIKHGKLMFVSLPQRQTEILFNPVISLFETISFHVYNSAGNVVVLTHFSSNN